MKSTIGSPVIVLCSVLVCVVSLSGACSSDETKADSGPGDLAADLEAAVDAAADLKVADRGKPPADSKPDTAPDGASVKKVTAIIAGGDHTCALLSTGAVRCWGRGLFGRLGYANINNIGDDELPSTAGDIKLGQVATKIYSGTDFNCALLKDGSLRCWGNNANGQLGYGNTKRIGDDEHPSAAGPVKMGGQADTLAAGGQSQHTCARRTTRNLLCWGHGWYGKLGYGNKDTIGDNETPASIGKVNIGVDPTHVAVGYHHTCARLTTGKVRCWGQGQYGALGYGDKNDIGDNEHPATAGDVKVGGAVLDIAAGYRHTCAQLTTGAVSCWGQGTYGRLGYANTKTIGDDETPASAGNVNLGVGKVTQVVAGHSHTCALLATGVVRCWGYNYYGQLGYAHKKNIGDDEHPATAGDVKVGGKVIQLAAGMFHTCALLSTGKVRCWGFAKYGQLGHANTNWIGDDETPASAGDVPVL